MSWKVPSSMVAMSLWWWGCAGPRAATDVPMEPADEDCPVHLFGVTPASGSEGVFYRSEITASLGGLEPDTDELEVTLSILDAWGNETAVDATHSLDDTVLTVVPDGHLKPDTLYELRVRYCDGQDGFSSLFRTSRTGYAVDLESRPPAAYALHLDESTTLGTLLTEQWNLWLLIGRTDGPTPTWIASWTRPLDYSQDLCIPTWTLSTETFAENPWFESRSDSPPPFVLDGEFFDAGDFGYGDITVSGAFTPEHEVDQVAMGMHLPGCTGDFPCVPCRHGPYPDCEVLDFPVPVSAAPMLVARTQADIDADPLCD